MQVKTKLTPGERQLAAAEELAEHDVDVAIRVGLAAFAVSGAAGLCWDLPDGKPGGEMAALCVKEIVGMFWRHVCYVGTHLGLPPSLPPFCDPCLAAYIKSVLCPSLHVRGGDSTGPGTPVLRRFDIGLPVCHAGLLWPACSGLAASCVDGNVYSHGVQPCERAASYACWAHSACHHPQPTAIAAPPTRSVPRDFRACAPCTTASRPPASTPSTCANWTG